MARDRTIRRDGPKRRRRTRRQLPYGGISLWRNAKGIRRERQRRVDAIRYREAIA